MIEENSGLADNNLEMVLDAYFERFNKALINNLIAKWQTVDGVFDEEGLVSAFSVLHKTTHFSVAEYEDFLLETFGDNAQNLKSLRRMCAQINHVFDEDENDFEHCKRLYGARPDSEIKRMMGECYKNFTVNYLRAKSQELKGSLNLEQDPYRKALIELGLINPEVTELLSEVAQVTNSANDNTPSTTFNLQTDSAKKLDQSNSNLGNDLS